MQKTTVAPYSQGNELVFGQNAEQQCVAMSLCSLVSNNTQGISSANDLTQIMDIGNQLYLGLSRLARKACLMQSGLPTALNVFDAEIINWNTVKTTLVLFTKKLLQVNISTVLLYEEPLDRSYLKATPIFY